MCDVVWAGLQTHHPLVTLSHICDKDTTGINILFVFHVQAYYRILAATKPIIHGLGTKAMA